jgi:hypothetical protein
VHSTEIFVAMVSYPRFEGAAHRNINLMLRCAAPSTLMSPIIATNITVRCTFYKKILLVYLFFIDKTALKIVYRGYIMSIINKKTFNFMPLCFCKDQFWSKK